MSLAQLSKTFIRTMTSIPKTQYGFKFDRAIMNLKLVKDMPVAVPTSNQILLKVEAAGLCHSDLHIFDGLDCGDDYVMGHEIFGLVAKLGDEVLNFKVGDRVAAFGPNSCGLCSNCRSGIDNDCTSPPQWLGLGTDGGYQQYMLVRNPRNLVKVPDEVDSAAAAAITDAMLTPYHAIKTAGLNPASRALFVGAGGLGSTAVQIAKAFGAHVTVVDKKALALELVKAYGADEVYTELPAGTKPASFDACLDFVSVQSTFDMCQKYVKNHGIVIPVGLGATNLTFDLADLALREVHILGCFWGSSSDLEECFELARKGKVVPKVTSVPLLELPQSIEKLKRGEITGRIIHIP